MAGVFSRLKQTLSHAWNAFDPSNFAEPPAYTGGGNISYYRPDRTRFRYTSEKTIISSIYTRLGIDVSGVKIFHVRTDDDGRYQSDVSSPLNNCLTVEANLDQGARMFRQTIAKMLFDEGVAAVVPVDTSADPTVTGAFDIQTMRVGKIVEWYPKYVRVSLYNEDKGYNEDIVLEKQMVAIIENPLYDVMNEPNSTLQRLIRKLNMLDSVDEASSSGKLDLIIQLPYVVKSEAKKQQALQRRSDLEDQLKNSTYGVAYADGTEKITQLNRPAENNLLAQIQYLTAQVYAELGLTDTIMNGTADELTMLNYIDRTIVPIMDAIKEEFHRKFLTKTARSQNQAIMYFRDQFSLFPLSQFGELADNLSRNEIATPNDLRTAIGWKPSKDPKADQLVNSNMPQPQAPVDPPALPKSGEAPLAIESGGNSQNGRSLQR